MKKPVLFTILLLCASLLIKAQDNKQLHSQPDSIIKIIPVEGSNSSYLYTIGGKLQTREDVKIRLMRYAPSSQEFSRAKNNLNWIYISFAGFAASSTLATIEYANNNKNKGATSAIVNGQATIIYQHHNLAGAYIFTGAATAFLTSAIINLIEYGKHGNRALKLYNSQYE